MGRYRHSMDVIFAWLLFAVFAASSVLLVLLGVRIYAGAASGLNQTDSTVLLSYLTEKLRTCPDRDAVLLAEGDRLVLVPGETAEGYAVWIYREEGYLKESLVPAGEEPIEGAGSRIGAAQDFRAEETPEGLLLFSVTDQEGQTGSRYFAF